ncbi:hypothetical protein HF086_015603 [Spodoptera exigua]|uniref:Ig-like domain-containing protein n=1 Tax=Spodoptera exigua TaxID=7107 RepID=A0A922M106_SPOEX|nr:hypothetical protein HF086_015603 [Spodoptera exigua]
MSESKPTESREETKSLARVTLSKDFIAAFNKQLIQMYENVSQASLESSNKPRMERSVWKSRKIKAVQSEEVTNEEDDKFFLRRRINWEAVKKYFGHDRVCNCKCRSDKAMCKACAASDAVIDELIFEFDNIGQYMKDHCTEIQTFFWMNPGGGQKLRDSVSRIDKSLADYYKRVKGKCQGRTCKTFTTYIDKRQLVKTSKETRPDSLTHVINELSVLAEDLDKTVSLQACFNQKLKEEGDKFIKAIHNCIMRKSLVKRSNPAGPPKKKLIKNVYSLDNINVNIICNPESSSSSESFEHTSSLVPHQENSHLNDPLLDYVLGTPKHKKRKGLKKLFPRKSKKKLFTYYTSDYTKRPRLHFKRQINYGVVTPLISDGGGAFWNDYIKPSTNEPRVARDSRHDKSIQIAVVQKEANGGPKIQKIIEKPIRHQTPNTIFMTVKTTPQRKFREAETTMDDLTHNINQLLQLFGSLQDIESMNKNSNRSTMFLNHTTASFRDEQTTSTVRNKLDQTTIEKKSTKCIKKVKTKMHYKGDAVPDKPMSTTPKSKTLTQTSTLTTDQSERIEIQMEQNEKVLHSKEKEIEQNAKQLAQNEKTSGLKNKQFEQNDKKTAKINKQSEQINKQSEQINKQSEQINTQSEQINKQSEQIDKQTEQINQQSDLREKQFQLFEKQSQQDDKQSEQIDKLSDSKEQQFGQNEKQFDQSGRTELFQELQKQLDQTETSDGVTLDTSYDALDSLESKMASNSKAPTGTPASSKKLTSTTQNPMNASDTIIIRDVTSLRSGKNKTKTTNTMRTTTTERTTVKSKVLASVTPKKDEFAETKPQSLIDTETKVTTTTATSFLAKLKTATLKFFDGVSQRSKHPQKTTTPITTETTTLTTRQTDKLSTTETDPMYLDDSSSVTTRMSPTIVIINEYDNQISSNVLEDPNKDVNSYRNLLLSIIQYETNKLNDEWHRIAYGDRDRDEVGVKRSVAQKVPATTTKASKKPKTTPKSVSTDEDYDVIEGIKDLKNLELPEPTTQARKPAGLLNRIVNKMGMRVVPPDGKQVAKKPSLREIASRKKLNRKRRLKLNSWKMETSTMPVTESKISSIQTIQSWRGEAFPEADPFSRFSGREATDPDILQLFFFPRSAKESSGIIFPEFNTRALFQEACDSRRTPKASQICDIQATVDHIRLLQKKVPTEDFENLVKNISCYKYKTAEQEFFIPYQRTGKRWDWIRNKRCLRLQVAKFNDDTELDNDQFDIVSFDDDSNDSFEKYVRGDYGIYKIIRRKREAGLLKALDVGLRNIPPLKSTESEVYVMLGDSVTLHCVPYIPIASANKFYWYTDRKRMLNHNNVKVEGIKVTIHNAEPRNTGRYTCRMGQTVQREVQLTVMTIPEYDVVFLPVYKTEEICSYDDLKAIQDLGPLLSKQSNCGKTCSVRIDEPVCQRDRGTNSSLLRSTAVISMNPNHRINCSLQCRRDIASSLVMLSAVNTPYLADIAASCPPDTSSKRGDNTCKSCPRGTRAEPGASQCYAIKTPPRSIAIGCSVCILLSMIVHILSREMDPVELETSDEERTCTPKTAASITAAYAHTHTRPLSPSRVILPRFFRPSLTSSRATDSQETKFELWKERHIPPPLPPIDFDL